ncbi:MAG: carboxylating nicotinate-nucleotide diphosphorylase [Gemmatimonadota bacterium]
MNPTSANTRGADRVRTIEDDVLRLIDIALAEDRGSGDWTSRWIVPARTRARARIVSRASGVLAGLDPALAVFVRLDPRVHTEAQASDGETVEPGDVICELNGPARAILTGERVALNFLQRLSGVATHTRRFVEAAAGTGARILDTRKTTPGWRTLEKAAVRAGGGTNHRRGLYDAVLVKDNHVAIAGGVSEAVRRIQESNTRALPVIVEVRDRAEVDEALAAGVDRLLLDNMDVETMREVVRLARGRLPKISLEASGNVTLERVRAIAETGVDFISVGALTHSATALDISLDVLHP